MAATSAHEPRRYRAATAQRPQPRDSCSGRREWPHRDSRGGGELWLVLESGEKAIQGGQEMPWVGGLLCTLRVEFGKNWV